jgi:hypothetical protein
MRAGPEFQPAVRRLRLWGLALGPASPCADCHGAGTLGLTVCGVLTRICAYSFRHPHFPALHELRASAQSFHPRFTALGTLPYPLSCLERRLKDRASAGRLTPTILGARPLDE